MNRSLYRIFRALLCALTVCVWMTSAAMAQTVQRAALPVDAADFSHYPSFEQEGDRWSVQAIQADALMDRFWAQAAKGGAEGMVFHLAVEGNASTGVWTPVLRLYTLQGRKSLNIRAVSILADGMRYDLAASSAHVRQGRASAEEVTLPLTHDAVTALQALPQAKAVSLRLFGDDIWTYTLSPAARTERGQMDAASLTGLTAGFALLEEVGLSAYGLWDLSASALETAYGYAPAFASSEVTAALGDSQVTDAFGMVLPDDRGPAAKAAQAILLQSGFLNEASASVFSQQAADAARRAQHYLGLIETGCMDAQLQSALAQGPAMEAPVNHDLHSLASTLGVSLNRYWFARAVSASANENAMRSVANTDHLLLAADGWIRNLSAMQMHLFMQVEASVIYNGEHAFRAEMVCEGNDGASLDTLLLPLENARLILYAELPAYLAKDPSAQWTVRLTAGGTSIDFDLQ